MDKKIELVHFQLTKNCNLRCWFCGQWGKKGFFSDSIGEAMELEDWKKAIDQLADYREKSGIRPDIILWGGEPLACEYFEEIVRLLREKDFRLGIVTNATMIDKYADILKTEFEHIYASVDGTREIHDKIRGEGVYDKAAENLALLSGTKAKITLMAVISEDNYAVLEEMPEELLKLNCDEILFQDMIALTASEAAEYKTAMKEYVGTDAVFIDSWVMDSEPIDVTDIMQRICEKYPGRVKYIHHGGGHKCKSPYSHIHIAWNGNVLFCTDFYDFSAGNVKKLPLWDIFCGEQADKYRAMIENDACPTCRHCSWCKSDSFGI